MAKRLTAKEIEHLTTPGRHWVDDHLYLQIVDAHVRSWIYRFTLNGKARWSGLGSYPYVSLAAARQKRDDEQTQIRKGLDPVDERKRARAGQSVGPRKTFKACAQDYIANHEHTWVNAKHRNQWHSTLKAYVFPVIGEVAVDAVDTEHVRAILQPLWQTKRETAKRVRQQIESILDFAKALGLRQGDNPARWRGHIANIFPARAAKPMKHHAALPYPEIGDFMVKLRAQGGIAARALEFVILNACRTGDVIGQKRADAPPMIWQHVDLASRVWTIPRTKTGSELRVPLSRQAIAVVEAMQAIRSSDVVFAGMRAGEPLSNSAMLVVLDLMGFGRYTVHGFRSCFRDWAAECTSFPSEVAEMALAHTIEDRVEAAYRRGDLFEKRRKLMQAWADFCDRSSMTAAVVPLRNAS